MFAYKKKSLEQKLQTEMKNCNQTVHSFSISVLPVRSVHSVVYLIAFYSGISLFSFKSTIRFRMKRIIARSMVVDKRMQN